MPVIQQPRNAWRVPAVETSGVLVDAHDYYAAFYERSLQARRFILLSGWQFDRDVCLLRGDDVAKAAPADGEVRLLKFLNGLCERNPELRVCILAWDFHLVFALEREWMQKVYFHWATNERLQFMFDARHPDGGSHHQKFAIIDGEYAFLGGIDLCESRWDDRRHLVENPDRVQNGAMQKPYHDVQAYFTGKDINRALVELFCDRWERAGCAKLDLSVDETRETAAWVPRGALPIPADRVALSRTDPQRADGSSAVEVKTLIVDAIAAAERFVYLETQYFSSRQICDAFEARMRATGRPKLQIVMVLNRRAEALKEEVAVGLRQTEVIERLRRVAAETGHALGAYYSLADGAKGGGGDAVATYIHSKLMIVDDRFFTLGSANFTNRSMGLDTELHAAWEASPDGDPRLERAIRRVRVSLLVEHLGDPSAVRALAEAKDLVGFLDATKGRLVTVPGPTERERELLDVIDPQALPFDPEGPEPEGHDRDLFRGGISALWQRLTG